MKKLSKENEYMLMQIQLWMHLNGIKSIEFKEKKEKGRLYPYVETKLIEEKNNDQNKSTNK